MFKKDNLIYLVLGTFLIALIITTSIFYLTSDKNDPKDHKADNTNTETSNTSQNEISDFSEDNEDNQDTKPQETETSLEYTSNVLGISFSYPSNYEVTEVNDTEKCASMDVDCNTLIISEKGNKNQFLKIEVGRFFDGPKPTGNYLDPEKYSNIQVLKSSKGTNIVRFDNNANLTQSKEYSTLYGQLYLYTDFVPEQQNSVNTMKADYFTENFPLEINIDTQSLNNKPFSQIRVTYHEVDEMGNVLTRKSSKELPKLDSIVTSIRPI